MNASGDRSRLPVPDVHNGGRRQALSEGAPPAADLARPVDPLEPVVRLFQDLRTGSAGLSSREAARRLQAYGYNELARRGTRRWPRELAGQFTQPRGSCQQQRPYWPGSAGVRGWASRSSS
jgi:hypothetical protein